MVAGQPQQLYLKAAHAPIQPGADETDLTDLLARNGSSPISGWS
ncbi:hypothetical protein QY882_09570 [Latilactobacillus sakei]